MSDEEILESPPELEGDDQNAKEGAVSVPVTEDQLEDTDDLDDDEDDDGEADG